MTHKVQDWINSYIDSLLGERSASSSAREAQSEDEALLMKAARRLKYLAARDETRPRPDFVAGLERELRKELAKASPKVRRMPLWRQSWARTLGGVAAAAAVIMLLVWSRTGSLLPTAPMAAPAPAAERAAATAKQEAVAPAAAPDRQEAGTSAAAPAKREAAAPAPGPALKPPGGAPAAPAPGGAPVAPPPGAAPAAPAASASPPARTLAQAVAEAQTIVLGQVVEVSPAPSGEPGKGAPGPSNVQVTLLVERYLKGPLPDARVTLQATSGATPGAAFAKGERVLVMARDPRGDGVLEALDYPRTRDAIAPAQGASPGAPADAKRLEGPANLTVDELVSRVEGLLGGKP